MGVDIDMCAGIGVHITNDELEAWMEQEDYEDGVYEAAETACRGLKGVSYSWPGNSWLGEENGLMFWVSRLTESFDMGREAQAGVYDLSSAVGSLTVEERDMLNAATRFFGVQDKPVKPYVAVTVS